MAKHRAKLDVGDASVVLTERLAEEGGGAIEVAPVPALNRANGFAPVAVPPDYVMVLGDNRDNSRDSRYIGFIDERRITGRAERVVLSHDPLFFWLPREHRWWLPLHS